MLVFLLRSDHSIIFHVIPGSLPTQQSNRRMSLPGRIRFRRGENGRERPRTATPTSLLLQPIYGELYEYQKSKDNN